MGDDSRLGDIILYRKSLIMLCGGCHRTQTVDLRQATSRLGYDVTLSALKARAVCERCRSRIRFKVME